VAAILPNSLGLGLIYLAAYATGLAAALLAVAYFGRVATRRLGWYADPSGRLRKVIGTLFIVVGLMIVFGLDRALQTFVVEHGWYDPVSGFEDGLRR